MSLRKAALGVEALEPREVPAGFSASAAVQADFAQLHTDTRTFYTGLTAMLPTLQKDQQAVATAIRNANVNDVSVETAQAALNADLSFWLAKIQLDVKAYVAATTSDARSAIAQQYFADLNTGGAAVQADAVAVQTAIQADPGVQAAQAKFNTDTAPLYAELAVIQADYVQLHKDLGS